MNEDEPLVESRGLVRIADFCREYGAERHAVDALLLSGELDGVVDEDGRPFGLFDDVLPSRDRLLSLGLTVSRGYDPDALRSYVDETPDPDEPAEPGGSTWTMSW